MARLAAALAMLTMVAWAPSVQASDPEETLTDVANAAHVDKEDLRGAVATTGMDPHTYLKVVGEYPTPIEEAAPAPATGPPYGIFDRLAQCESGGDWHANTGNSYYGGIQEDMAFWRNYGGPEYASRPDLASRAAQIIVGQRGQASQGWIAWPTCSRIIGLR